MGSALWPVHPQLQAGEILSSWMVRIAQANGFKVHTFYAEHFGRQRAIWTRDIDTWAPAWLIDELARKTGASSDAVSASTLRSFESIAFERINPSGATRWVLPVGIYHRTRRCFGQQFCPACLAADAVPYLRTAWRLAVSMVCSMHGVWLASGCPSCGRALAPHRADIASGRGLQAKSSLRFCGYCRADLSKSSTTAGAEDVSVQVHLDGVLREGFALVGGTPVYSHLYLDGLRMLMQGLRRQNKPNGAMRQVFELLPASARLQQLRLAIQLTQDWPVGLIEHCQTARRPYSSFVREKEPHPWWVWSVFRREFFSGVEPISRLEATAILDATQRWTGRRSGGSARWLFGRCVQADDLPLPATENEVDLLMASMDHAITAGDAKQRQLLLRDKIMLLIGRRWQLALTELAALRTSDVEVEGSSAPFWDNARQPNGPRQLLAWYAAHLRPGFAADCQGGALFVSASGRGLTSKAIGQRLAQAVATAGLRRGLASWPVWSRNPGSHGTSLLPKKLRLGFVDLMTNRGK